MRRAWIISSGTELVLGQTLDTNSAWLARELAGLGIRTERHITLPDTAGALREVLLAAVEQADLVLITGGLGPTEDDLTRFEIAAAAGVELERDAASVERMRAFFATRGRQPTEANLVQALIPRGARALPNSCGTAPGIRIELRGVPCFALPGVPTEMRAMFAASVAPEIRSLAEGTVLRTRTLHTFGIPEAELGSRIADLMRRGNNPEVGTTAEFSVIGIRMNATAASEAAALEMLDVTEREIRARLGSAVYGVDGQTLAGAAGRGLLAAGRTLAVAESCTGGLLGALITDEPGSSAYFLGGIISYANEIKRDLLGVPGGLLDRHGAVSRPVAGAMAEGAAVLLRADYGLGITGIAGPTGGTPEKPVGLVYVGLSTPVATRTFELRLGSDAPREAIRTRAARAALNALRLELLESAGPRAADAPSTHAPK